MIELRRDALHFSFPEVHGDAELTIHFQRTLRIPDDDTTYPLPPGLGRFPLRHVELRNPTKMVAAMSTKRPANMKTIETPPMATADRQTTTATRKNGELK